MPETLLSEPKIVLFGRLMDDLALKPGDYKPNHGAVAGLLRSEDARIARIYSFAYQNELVDLASPALFVVNGEGTSVDGKVETQGLAHVLCGMAEDLRCWSVDRDDVSVRLDVSTGSYRRILLDYELADEGLQDFVRGSAGVGAPANLTGSGRRPRRGRRWRSEDD